MTDPRLIPANGRVAAAELMGREVAERYSEGQWRQCGAPVADLCGEPGGAISCQLLFGERFRVLETRQGWSFGQSERDGYVGYVRAAALCACTPRTHWVGCALTRVYPKPDIKTAPGGWYPFGARLRLLRLDEGFWELDGGGFVPAAHVRESHLGLCDVLKVTRMFIGFPYLWGGNGPLGIDCSGLVQMALLAAGQPCPRDSDMQREWMKCGVAEADSRPGDCAFWDGHVGILDTDRRLIHATECRMRVMREPFEAVRRRIAGPGGSEFHGFGRPPQC